MYSCAKFEGKKVIITCDYKYGQIGFIKKLNERGGSYTHGIFRSKDNPHEMEMLAISDLPKHAKYSWKPYKLRIG